jgi:hypothetical protein
LARLFHQTQQSFLKNHKTGVVAFAAMFVAAGVLVMYWSFGAGSPIAFEAEIGALTGGATVATATGQSGTGAVKFGGGATGSCLSGAGVAANSPGSADPFGGCWPGPNNTGVPAGTTLKVLNAGQNAPGLTWEGSGWWLGQCGTVIDGYELHGSVYGRYGNTSKNPATPCITIKNSAIYGGVDMDVACLNAAAGNAANHCGPIVVQDSFLESGQLDDRAEVLYDDYHLYRDNIQGTPICNGTCNIQDSWIHNLWAERGFHMDAISSNGNGAGGASTITHNYIDCAAFRGPVDPQPGLGCSTVLAAFPDFASITLKATYNYLAPAQQNWPGTRDMQPPYCINPGPGTTKPYATVNDYIAYNVFARGFTGHCGLFGAVYGFGNGDVHTNGTDAGNVWGPGNRWDDGQPMDTPDANAKYNCNGQGCLTY